MARLPGTRSCILDGNLNPVAPPTGLDQSVLLIGTAYDGPMYEPIVITSLENAEKLFGPQGNATLIRAIRECWDSSEGTPNIRAMRIGNGLKASYEFEETSGSGTEAVTTGQVAMSITARFPGQKYNLISMKVNDNGHFEVTYPDPDDPSTFLSSTFPFNINAGSNSDSIKNVMDLANAINASTKLGRVVVAEVSTMNAAFELKVKSGDTGVDTAGGVQLDLSDILADGTYQTLVQGTGILTGDTFSPDPPTTAGNRINRLTKIYSISNSGEETLDIDGNQIIEVDLPLINATDNTNFNSIQAIADWDGTADYWVGPSGSGPISEFVEVVNNRQVGGANGALGTGTISYTFDCYMPPDDSQSTDDSGKMGVSYSNFYQSGSVYDTYSIPASGLMRSDAREISFEYSTDNGRSWNSVPYDKYDITCNQTPTITNGAVTSEATISLTPGFVSDGGFAKGTRMRISYDSILGTMTEGADLQTVRDTADFTNYFIRGDEIIFGGTSPSDLIVRYGTFTEYEVGTNVILEDAENGVIRFTDPTLQPGPGGTGLAPSGSIIGLEYEYLPEWIDLGSPVQLAGGTNGTSLSTNVLYNELATAYDTIKNYPVDIIVPLGAYLDSAKTAYHPQTGRKYTTNAGFHKQLSTLLNSLESDVNETIGIISVKPPSGTTSSVIDAWVTKLTDVDLSDATRGANIMQAYGDKNVSVTAFIPYGGIDGSPSFAGYIASLSPHVSPTNKAIPGLYPAFNLSRSQNEKMLDMRYVTMRSNRNITTAVTAAPSGSDYELLTTVRITYAAMDVVREVADPFIGQPNSAQNRLAMETSIQRGLQAMVAAGALRRYDFSVKSNPNQQVLGIVDIDMVLVPVFEIRYINVTVKLRSS
mgnify:CR=1 FL=1